MNEIFLFTLLVGQLCQYMILGLGKREGGWGVFPGERKVGEQLGEDAIALIIRKETYEESAQGLSKHCGTLIEG